MFITYTVPKPTSLMVRTGGGPIPATTPTLRTSSLGDPYAQAIAYCPPPDCPMTWYRAMPRYFASWEMSLG